MNLSDVFQAKEKEIQAQVNFQKTVDDQLNKLGHQLLNKRTMLYDRNLSSKIPKKYIYSDKNYPPNGQTAIRVIDGFILKKIDFTLFPEPGKLDEFKSGLREVMAKFLELHRSCPYRVFLHCYCKNTKNAQIINKQVSAFNL